MTEHPTDAGGVCIPAPHTSAYRKQSQDEKQGRIIALKAFPGGQGPPAGGVKGGRGSGPCISKIS